MVKYYHYIVEEIKTGERSEIIVRGKLRRNYPGYKIIGCCGYHEKPGEEEKQ